jgi:hypothetical protein
VITRAVSAEVVVVVDGGGGGNGAAAHAAHAALAAHAAPVDGDGGGGGGDGVVPPCRCYPSWATPLSWVAHQPKGEYSRTLGMETVLHCLSPFLPPTDLRPCHPFCLRLPRPRFPIVVDHLIGE